MIVAPPPPIRSVDIFGQPSRSSESFDRPLGSTLHVFRSGRTVRLPSNPPLPTLATLAARMLGNPGKLMTGKARRIVGIYLVPTTNGWACISAPRFETCVRGLLRSGVVWMFQSTAGGIDVWGFAADEVRRVTLGGRTATLRDNVFYVFQPLKLTSTARLPKTLGTLVVTYRDGRPAARVAIH